MDLKIVVLVMLLAVQTKCLPDSMCICKCRTRDVRSPTLSAPVSLRYPHIAEFEDPCFCEDINYDDYRTGPVPCELSMTTNKYCAMLDLIPVVFVILLMTKKNLRALTARHCRFSPLVKFQLGFMLVMCLITFSTQAGDNGKRLEDWLEQNPDEAVPVLDEQEAANPPPPPPPRRPRLVAHPPLMLALPLNYSLVDHDDSLANRIISDIAHYLATHYEVDVVEEVNDHYQQGMNQNRSRAVRQYDRREVWEMLLRTLRKHIFD